MRTPIYDDDKEKNQYSPEQLKAKEDELGDYYNDDPSLTEKRVRDDTKSDEHRDAREASSEAEANETKSLEDRLGALGESIKESDSEDPDGGFFRDDGSLKAKGKTRIGGLLKNRKAMLGLGGGALGLVIGAVFLFNFLNIFRLDHILNNVDAKTFARFNASFEGRSDAWMRAYVRLRLMEIDGATRPGDDGNLFFRSNHVDTNHPIRDWYRTMRTGRFEKDLLEKQGIAFTHSLVGPDGKFRAARITIKDTPLDFDLTRRYPDIDIFAIDNPATLSDTLNKMDWADVDQMIDVEFFDNDRDARHSMRRDIKANTHWARVLKRRHIRQDMGNMNGVREWRFFEKTRNQARDKKIDVQRKILRKVFVGNSNASKFLGCLLAGTSCPRNSDPVGPDMKADGGGVPGDGIEADDITVEGDGDSIKATSGGDLAEAVEEVGEEVTKDIGAEATEEVAEEVTRGPIRQMTRLLASRFTGSIISMARTVTAVHNVFAGGANSTIVTVVKNARLSQLTAIYTTYSIARDQMKSGELTADEVGALYSTMEGFERSEGWHNITEAASDPGFVPAASAQAANDTNEQLSKQKYCSKEENPAPTFKQFAWYCDHQKPNNGGRIESLSEAYDSTFGYLFAPSAAVVNGFREIPGVSWALDQFDALTGAAIEKVISGLGLEDNVETLMSGALMQLLEFAGVGPMFDGTQPGVANYLIAGGAGTAEGSTRASGGIKSTKESKAFSNQLAAAYNDRRLSEMSLFERYVSLNNSESPGAKATFAITTTSPGEFVANAASSLTNFSWLRPLTGLANAQSQRPSSTFAEWAGVETYDIPQQCYDLDPLTATIDQGTNFTHPDIAGDQNLTWDIVRDTDAFYEKVYSWAGRDEGRLSMVESIYNCHLLDARIMGSLGYLYGYKDDHGYEIISSGDPTSDETVVVPNGETIVGNPFEPSDKIPCAEGTDDLGTQTGYYNERPIQLRLCGIREIPASGNDGLNPSTPGTPYYVEGANGHAIVNSRVSGAVRAMAIAAKSDGINLTLGYSFRPMALQEGICTNGRNPECEACYIDGICHATSYAIVAKPGTSLHQSGTALDFYHSSPEHDKQVSTATCTSGRATAPDDPIWVWLNNNAKRFGYGQYAVESWHWDPSEDGCGS